MKIKFKEIFLNRVNPDDKLIVAVSGGLDSVVLLDLIIKIHPLKNIIVAHVNHGMRKEADYDEKFVGSLANKYKITYFSKKFKLAGKSEEAARKVRYRYLESIRIKEKAHYIVTAHHLNDQAETLILNLTRGTGPLNFWGMQELKGNIFRPLLQFSKEEIKTYAIESKLGWVEDKTNTNLNYSRNFIRLKVLPELEKINPKFLMTVKNEIELGQAAAKELEDLAERKEQKLKEGTALKLDALKKETPFMQELIIFRFLREMMGRTGDVYRKNVTALRTLLDSKGTKKTIIGTFTFEKNYDKIIFSPKKSSLEGEKRIIPVRVYKFGDFTLKSGFSSGKSSKNNILLLPEIAYNLRVRSMQPGDRIKTKTGTKKISDVFTDAKVNANERKSWPIVVMGNEVVWVPLLTAYEKAISESKDKVLIIEVQK